MQLLAGGQINDALSTAKNLLQNASIPVRNRQAQPWFNKSAMTVEKKLYRPCGEAESMPIKGD